MPPDPFACPPKDHTGKSGTEAAGIDPACGPGIVSGPPGALLAVVALAPGLTDDARRALAARIVDGDGPRPTGEEPGPPAGPASGPDRDAEFRGDLCRLIERIAALSPADPAMAARARLDLGKDRRACFHAGPNGGVVLRIAAPDPASGRDLELITSGGWTGAFAARLPLRLADGVALAAFSAGVLAMLCPGPSARVWARIAGGGTAGAESASALMFRLDRYGAEVVPQPFILTQGLPRAPGLQRGVTGDHAP